LIDDETQRDETTPEQEETPEQSEADQPAGPVAEDDPSSSQAAGDAPSSTPPAGDAPDSKAEASAPESEASEGLDAPEAEEEPAAEPAEEPVAEAEGETGEAEAEKAAEPEVPVAEEKPAAEKKKDVIPGADLEPIAVEAAERPLSAEEQARKEAEEEERRQREAALTGEAEEEPSAASRAPAKLEGDARFLATGKRKTAIARVTLLPGSGKVEINKRAIEEFFPRPLHQTIAVQPLTVTGYEKNVDVRVRVHGGGISGQAGAVRHGIARALTEVDPELRGELKRRGFLTRDARAKERRKAGLKKARKRPQFSKR
jgi:small subunit ribosomal protein S9